MNLSYNRNSVLLLFCTLAISQICMAQKAVQIVGKATHKSTEKIRLFGVREGRPYEIAQTLPNAQGQFALALFPDNEGFYLIGTGNESSAENNHVLWLKQGDMVELELNDTTYRLRGDKNTAANKSLYEWFSLTQHLRNNSIYLLQGRGDGSDALKLFAETEDQAKTWLRSRRKTKVSAFEQYLPKFAQLDLELMKTTNLTVVRSTHFGQFQHITASFSDLYQRADAVYGYPWGRLGFRNFIMVKSMGQGAQFKGVDQVLQAIPNDTLKGDYLIDQLRAAKTYENYLKIFKPHAAYLMTESQKKQHFNIENTLRTINPGDKGYDFQYLDKDGKPYAFHDFVGKVVVLDLWATWCSPCLGQIPHLEKLEEEFSEDEVVFVSISVDEKKNEDKWRKMLQDKQMKGVQLFASGWSDIANYYKVTGIPRFMIFDRQGNIVNADAPFPSDSKFREIIVQTLAKK